MLRGEYEAALEELRIARLYSLQPIAGVVRAYVNLLRGDFGESLINGMPISEQIAHVLPYTIQLTLASVLIGVLLGVPLGILTALNRNNPIDYAGRIISLVGLSVPAFYFGILLMFIFAVELGVLPAVGG